VLAAINLPTKFEVYLRPLQGYEKGYKVWNMEWFGIVRDYLRSLKIVPLDRQHTSSY